jgi:hypothetical protein
MCALSMGRISCKAVRSKVVEYLEVYHVSFVSVRTRQRPEIESTQNVEFPDSEQYTEIYK